MKLPWKRKPQAVEAQALSAQSQRRGLPEGRFVMLTWAIPEDFGGLTNVLLHRAWTFAELGEKQIDILTFDSAMDMDATRRRLEQERRFGTGDVRLRNLWEEIGQLTDSQLESLAAGTGSSAAEEKPVPVEGDPGRTADRRDDRGRVLQMDHYRSDGTLWGIDRRDVRKRGTPGGRRFTLFDSAGQPVGQWTSPSKFYFAWLDRVLGDDETFLISDSQFLGGFIHRYKRDNVTLAQVVHNAHLRPDAAGPFERISKGKAHIVKNADAFDLLAVLTESQAEDLRAADLAGEGIRVIPNSRTVKPTDLPETREKGKGVMLARLTGQKRVEDAVRAAAWAHTNEPGVSLSIYGDGDKRPRIERVIRRAKAEGVVRLEGHKHGAAEEFRTANFSVLSSNFEGFGLVLVESMAAGCIPIAYDIRYGPSDIITDGVDGFLVPSGDVHGLAAAIHRLSVMDEAQLQRMREAAILRAHDFGDETVMQRWAGELSAAQQRRTPAPGKLSGVAAREAVFTSEGTVRIYGQADVPEAGDKELFVSWEGRHDALIYSRVRVGDVHQAGKTMYFSADIPVERLQKAAGDVVDLSLDVAGGGHLQRQRLQVSMEQPRQKERGLRIYATKHGNLSISAETVAVGSL